ncbi:unnamed protein product [Urochloa humidicola]
MAPALISLVFFAILTFTAGATAASEVAALLAFKRALTVPPAASTFFATWDAAAASPCNFTGVTCDPAAATGTVTAVSIQGQGIAAASVPFGQLCGALPALATLSLPDNAFAGGVAGLTACTALRDLTLAFNGFSGAVPDLSPLTKLRTLNISSNKFVGAFPWAPLGAARDLVVLALGDNPFLAPTDSFPDEVTKLTNLTVLYASTANIGGVIPPGIGDLVNLIELELADNYLTGDVPAEITKLTELQQLYLYNNALSGYLPSGFGKLTKLQYFDASTNNLSGVIPPGIGDLVNLIELELANNYLTGEVPAEITKLTELQQLDLHNNSLSGHLPLGFGKLTMLDKTNNT